MAFNTSEGVSGWFIKDAAAHAAGSLIPAIVTKRYDNSPSDDTVSILAFEVGGPPIPYGPSPTSEWTADPTEVRTDITPDGYYFVVNATTVTAQSTADAGVASATSAGLAASGDLTPQQLISANQGSWIYDPIINGWRVRFANERLELFYSAPQSLSNWRILVKDVAGVGGGITANVYKAARVAEPSTPVYAIIGSAAPSAGDGGIHEITVTLASLNGQSVHKIDIVSGTINGGVLPADQYQILQIHPEV